MFLFTYQYYMEKRLHSKEKQLLKVKSRTMSYKIICMSHAKQTKAVSCSLMYVFHFLQPLLLCWIKAIKNKNHEQKKKKKKKGNF